MANNILEAPQKVRHRTTIQPSNSTSRYTPQRIENIKPYTWTFVAAPLNTAKRWKQPTCPLADEWINKTQSIHAMGYSLATARVKGWHATTGTNLEHVTLCESSQTQEVTSCVAPFTWKCPTRQVHRHRKWITRLPGMERENRGWTPDWPQGFLLQWWECSGSASTLRTYLNAAKMSTFK